MQSPPGYEELGHHLRKLREERAVGETEGTHRFYRTRVAKAADISPAYLNKIERGERLPSASVVDSVVRVLADGDGQSRQLLLRSCAIVLRTVVEQTLQAHMANANAHAQDERRRAKRLAVAGGVGLLATLPLGAALPLAASARVVSRALAARAVSTAAGSVALSELARRAVSRPELSQSDLKSLRDVVAGKTAATQALSAPAQRLASELTRLQSLAKQIEDLAAEVDGSSGATAEGTLDADDVRSRLKARLSAHVDAMGEAELRALSSMIDAGEADEE